MFDEEPGCDAHEQCRFEIEKLNERIKALEDALKAMLVVCKESQSYNFVKVAEIIRAALEVK